MTHTSGHTQLLAELRLLIDAAADRVQPWLHRLGTEQSGQSGKDGQCPLCAALAVTKGERSELASQAAEHIAALLSLARSALRPDTPESTSNTPEPMPEAQRITVRVTHNRESRVQSR